MTTTDETTSLDALSDPTTLLPIEREPELPLTYRIGVDSILGVEVGALPVARIGQDLDIAVRARVTGLSEREGYKERVRTLRVEVQGITAIDDEPAPLPAPKVLPQEAKVVTIDRTGRWFGLGCGIGMVAWVALLVSPYLG